MPLLVTIHDQEQTKDEIIHHNGMMEMYRCTTVFAVGAFGIAPSNATQNWKKDLNAVKTCASGSAGSAAAGTGLLAAGSNVISTAGKFGGSTPGTSLASQFFRTILPQSIDATWAPTLMNPLATSSSLGGVVGRWVPIAGEGLLLYSGVKFLNCVSDNGDGFW